MQHYKATSACGALGVPHRDNRIAHITMTCQAPQAKTKALPSWGVEASITELLLGCGSIHHRTHCFTAQLLIKFTSDIPSSTPKSSTNSTLEKV